MVIGQNVSFLAHVNMMKETGVFMAEVVQIILPLQNLSFHNLLPYMSVIL